MLYTAPYLTNSATDGWAQQPSNFQSTREAIMCMRSSFSPLGGYEEGYFSRDLRAKLRAFKSLVVSSTHVDFKQRQQPKTAQKMGEN